MTTRPSAHVLDLFAVPEAVLPLPGGQGSSVRSGDLVLSPGRDADVLAWLAPVLARLAVRLDERPGRRGVRIAMPVPARNGEWVVEGWGASRYEPGTAACHDVEVLLATARLLHAELDGVVRSRPAVLDGRADRWTVAERLAFGSDDEVTAALLATGAGRPESGLVRRLLSVRGGAPVGRDQLVHADLAGNVLLDPDGSAVVLDVSPCWRPVRWAEAVCALDAVLWLGAPREVLARWSAGPGRDALARAALFRVLSDRPVDVPAYERALSGILS